MALYEFQGSKPKDTQVMMARGLGPFDSRSERIQKSPGRETVGPEKSHFGALSQDRQSDQNPEVRIDMNFMKPISIFISGVLSTAMTDNECAHSPMRRDVAQ